MGTLMGIIWIVFKIVFWIFFSFAVLHALVTHFVFLYEMRLQAFKNNTTPSFSPSVLIKSFFTEIFCNFARLWLTLFLGLPYKTELDTLSDADLKTPILLVHGYGQTKMDWIWFKHQLKQKKVGPIYALNLCPPFASISDLAQLIKKKVKKIQEETGQTRIILIGHSMGGLTSSYYAEFLAQPNEVAAVITLASPFQGTTLAALGYGKNVNEMAPKSSFLQAITNRIESSSIPYHHVASKIDNMIVPWESALPMPAMEGHTNQLILDDHGHLKMLISPRVVEQVTEWIRKMGQKENRL